MSLEEGRIYNNPKEDYKTYIELFCDKIGMPYLVFALIFATWGWIVVLLRSTSPEREVFFMDSIEGLGFLWIFTGFFMLVMIKKLRDVSIDKFLDTNMPYPQKIKKHMQECLHAVFSPYKLKEIPYWFKKRHPYLSHPYLFNHLYPALFISIVAGAIGFVLFWLDPKYGLEIDIIIGGMGCIGAYFFAVIMGYMMIGITSILRKISNELKNSNEAQGFASIVKIQELKVLPLNILYSYTAIMISFPAVLWFHIFGGGPWKYANYFVLVAQLFFILLVLIFPSYYVHLIIKSVKEQFYKQNFSLITDMENKIHNKSATNLDLETYELSIKMLDKAEKIRTWPLDFSSVTKIVLSGVISSIPTIYQMLKD